LIENTKRLTTGDNSNVKLALPYTLYNRLAKDHIDSYSTKETRMAGLFIEDRDIELINGAVNDPIIRGDLIDIHHKFKEISQNANRNKKITIYTDSSLTVDRKRDIVRMGYG